LTLWSACKMKTLYATKKTPIFGPIPLISMSLSLAIKTAGGGFG